MRAGVGLGLGLRLGRLRRLLALRRRNARIVRRLGRKAQLGLQFRDPRRQRRHLRHQSADERVLLRVRETRNIRVAGHRPKIQISAPRARGSTPPESIRRSPHRPKR